MSTQQAPTPDLRYPIGRVEWPAEPLTPEERERLIADIEQAPTQLRAAVTGLTADQLDTPYRPGGWIVRQVVHHLADSHINSYVRFRLALTEDEPAVKGYAEEDWAELPDARLAPVELSLSLLEALHRRWVLLLRAMTAADFDRSFQHSTLGRMPLYKNLALYAWHGRHHTAQITALRARQGW